jgi:hypothetical protein
VNRHCLPPRENQNPRRAPCVLLGLPVPAAALHTPQSYPPKSGMTDRNKNLNESQLHRLSLRCPYVAPTGIIAAAPPFAGAAEADKDVDMACAARPSVFHIPRLLLCL